MCFCTCANCDESSTKCFCKCIKCDSSGYISDRSAFEMHQYETPNIFTIIFNEQNNNLKNEHNNANNIIVVTSHTTKDQHCETIIYEDYSQNASKKLKYFLSKLVKAAKSTTNVKSMLKILKCDHNNSKEFIELVKVKSLNKLNDLIANLTVQLKTIEEVTSDLKDIDQDKKKFVNLYNENDYSKVFIEKIEDLNSKFKQLVNEMNNQSRFINDIEHKVELDFNFDIEKLTNLTTNEHLCSTIYNESSPL